MELTIRQEHPGEFRAVEELTREAFWDVYVPGCTEHYFLNVMRKHPDFIPELDCVALTGNRLVGHIAYNRAYLMDPGGHRIPVLSFGPLSVCPDAQKQGVGGALIRHTLALAANMDFPAVLILGHPCYYHRFGFRSAEKWDITAEDGTYMPALMAYPLHPGTLDGISGTFHEPDIFSHFDEDAFAVFDAAFPSREKGVRASQKEFAFLSSLRF